jgi:hypothetical protein
MYIRKLHGVALVELYVLKSRVFTLRTVVESCRKVKIFSFIDQRPNANKIVAKLN